RRLRRPGVRLRQERSAPQARESSGAGVTRPPKRARKRAVAIATALSNISQPRRGARNRSSVVRVLFGVPKTPRLLQNQRTLASSAWERRTWDNEYGRRGPWCACGHIKVFHDLYHQRPDNEWEECWPIHAVRCNSAVTLCEVCEDCTGYEQTVHSPVQVGRR